MITSISVINNCSDLLDIINLSHVIVVELSNQGSLVHLQKPWMAYLVLDKQIHP